MAPQLLKKLRAVRRRLNWIDFCRKTLLAIGWTALALALIVLVSRLVKLPFEIDGVFPWVLAAGGAWLLIWACVGRMKLMQAAIEADQALGLKERLSTALEVAEPRSEAEAAVLGDAVEHAHSIRPARTFPMRLGRQVNWALAPTAAFALIWFLMPQFDLLAKTDEDEQAKQAVAVKVRKEASKALEEMAEKLNETKETAKPKVAEHVDRKIDKLAKQLREGQITREQAAARVDKLAEKLESRRSELAKKLEKAASMDSKGAGRFSAPIQKAMQKGDFAQAAKALQELKKKLQSGQLSEQERKALERELKALSMKMGQKSELSKCLAGAAQMMSEGQFNSALAGLEDAASSLLDMEALLKELEALDKISYDMDGRKAALCSKPGNCGKCGGTCLGSGLCSSCSGIGNWRSGASRNRGGGSGGPGIGSGAVRPGEEGAVGFQKRRIKGQMTPGKIIARLKIPGQQTPGEISTNFETLRVEYAQQAEDTIQNDPMPLEMRSFIRDYYDAIKYSDGAEETAPAAEGEREILAKTEE